VPVDGPSEESAVDDLHQDEGNGKTGDEAEQNPRGTEVGGLGHDRTKNLSPGGACGSENSDFSGALNSESGEGEGDAEGGDRDGKSAEKGGDSKGAVEDPEGFVPKSGLRVDEEFATRAKLFPEGVPDGLGRDAGFEVNGEAGQTLVLGQSAVGGAVEKKQSGFGSIISEDGGHLEQMSSCRSGKRDRIASFESATAGEVFRDDSVVALLAKFVGIPREGGKKSQRIVDAKDFESAGGEFGGGSIEEEADFAVGSDGTDSRGGEGEGFGLGVEGFECSRDEVRGGRDKEVSFDTFSDPLIDGGTKTMDHDGDADSHGDGDGERGGSEAVSVKTTGKSGAGKNREGEGQGRNER